MISNIVLLGFGNIHTVSTLGFGGVPPAAPIFAWTDVDAQSTDWIGVNEQSGAWAVGVGQSTSWTGVDEKSGS